MQASGVGKVLRDGDRDVTVLADIDIAVAAGEWLALLGPSGSGKSTLLQILGALDPDHSGTVTVAGQRLSGLHDQARAALRARTFGFVFQAFNLLPHLTARQNVLLAGHIGGTVDATRADALLARVGLGDKGHRRPGALSGGERQRVAIARALYNRPALLLCDEPTGSLDAGTAADVLGLFAELHAEGTALVMATHDAEVSRRCGAALRLAGGRRVGP